MCLRSASTRESERSSLRRGWRLAGDTAPHTVFVERDNAPGRRFYLKRGFAEVHVRSQEIEGHVLDLVECHRPI
jgi:hypothetical protein